MPTQRERRGGVVEPVAGREPLGVEVGGQLVHRRAHVVEQGLADDRVGRRRRRVRGRGDAARRTRCATPCGGPLDRVDLGGDLGPAPAQVLAEQRARACGLGGEPVAVGVEELGVAGRA